MSIRVDFRAEAPHFMDHLVPIWRALPPETRGICVVPKRMLQHAHGLKVNAFAYRNDNEALEILKQRSGYIVTAGFGDFTKAALTGRPQILCEHGAGQSYSNRQTSYAGGLGRGRAALFLCPNQQSADRNKQYYPHIPTAVIGCPKLDEWHRRPLKPRGNPPVVAISFHWNCQIAPEACGSWEYYRDVIPQLAQDERWQLLGHAHPRIMNTIRPEYEKLDIPVVERFDEVLEKADLYVVDNSSTLFEFASLDRPVVVLNAPWYRRWIKHGLRFWDCADVGFQCDRPEDLTETIARALQDPPEQKQRRREVMGWVYPVKSGEAAQTAAKAVMRHVKVAPGQVRMIAIVTHHDGKQMQPKGCVITVDKDKARLLEKRGLAQRF